MRPYLPLEILIFAPLLLGLYATAPWLAPVRRAFAIGRPKLRLAPGERLVAELRPDRGLIASQAAGLAAIVIALSLLEQTFLGIEAVTAYLPLLPFAIAGFIHLAQQSANCWTLTDRRVVTALGASLPLDDIGRIAIGPASLTLDGQGSQSVRLTALADARGTARLIRDTLER